MLQISARPTLIGRFEWLDNRATFVIGIPLITFAGAATTIIAPMLLDAASFARFALLNALFTYLSEFDLGLARLADRWLPHRTDTESVPLIGSLLRARYCVAIALAAIIILTACVSDWLVLLAGFGGIGILLSNGPVSVYRSRSNIAGLAFTVILTLFGMTLPRLGGLLVDGVRGCMFVMAFWCVMAAIVVNAPFVRIITHVTETFKFTHIIAQSIPLFAYGSAWLFYLLANRWVSWMISSPTDAGLFAFGANLTAIIAGMISSLSMPYYPRHLAKADPTRLDRELLLLLLLGSVGAIVGTLACRFGLAFVFPHFALATQSTAALLYSGVPLGLAAWLVPLVIARSQTAWEILVFPVCFVLMFGLMCWLNDRIGIEGQAWACLPPAMILLAAQLAFTVRGGMMTIGKGSRIWLSCLGVEGIGIVVWIIIFQ